MMDYNQVSQFEHLFWLQVLGDHARFMLTALAPSEVEYIQQANQFKQYYDQLLEQARSMHSAEAGNWLELAQHAQGLTEQFRMLKLKMISDHLACQIEISLPPTFISHMVNELEEYLRVLSYLVRGEIPPRLHPVHHHLLWLLDAAGHATAIEGNIDRVENQIIRKAEDFIKNFEAFYLKAVEMAGFLRARPDLFPALQRFNHQASLEIVLFSHFIQELEEMRIDCRALGTLAPLMADHMIREECYYLTKLYEVDPEHVHMMDCNPIAPRMEQ